MSASCWQLEAVRYLADKYRITIYAMLQEVVRCFEGQDLACITADMFEYIEEELEIKQNSLNSNVRN